MDRFALTDDKHRSAASTHQEQGLDGSEFITQCDEQTTEQSVK